jgi:two-component system, NarL family, response regulator LiaR
MTNNLITVCIIHPDKKITSLLCGVLKQKNGFACTGIFASGEDALLRVPVLLPAVVILDIHLPGINGIECIKKLNPLCGGTQFMIYTADDDAADVFAALKAGAASYILSTSPATKLPGYIRELHNGGSPISSHIARKIILPLQQPLMDKQQHYGITKREKEILLLLDEGCSYNAVADLLFISSKTVRKHIYNIYEKMHVGSKTEALNRFFNRH